MRRRFISLAQHKVHDWVRELKLPPGYVFDYFTAVA